MGSKQIRVSDEYDKMIRDLNSRINAKLPPEKRLSTTEFTRVLAELDTPNLKADNIVVVLDSKHKRARVKSLFPNLFNRD